jgi:hypothetical protein
VALHFAFTAHLTAVYGASTDVADPDAQKTWLRIWAVFMMPVFFAA